MHMSGRVEQLRQRLEDRFGDTLLSCETAYNEVTIAVRQNELLEICNALKAESEFGFEMLMDIVGVDYMAYGLSEWSTQESTSQGFSRGVEKSSFGRFSFHDAPPKATFDGPRFSISYHLLSVANNHRLRIKVACEDDNAPLVNSVVDIWASANWFEREIFDLFGIVFDGHPDLRRILTDYGFIGYPFRKDFPLVGNVEMRYDPEQGRVIYQPVTIEPRVLVPRVVRDDHRYIVDETSSKDNADDA